METIKQRTQTAVYVYEAPLRLWHWITVLSIIVLCITGYFIGSPLPTMPGEASDHFLMGYIRFAHFAAGYVVAVGFLGRIYWAFVGNSHSRELFLVPFFNKKWWLEVLYEVRWYLFLEKTPKKYIGHNPLGQLSMFCFFVIGITFMIITGFALYAEGLGRGSWADTLFGWVIPLMGQSQDAHTWHHLGMWYLVIFIMMHVYVAIREDIMSRQSLISTMIGGWRMFKDDRPD
ncbi:Ni/Fe-hydrogenase, b-type cytochrome subunit [Amphritea sp. 2_MG-2023]|uniref:Ni/Fe-hydrogenase, b-type cytochrome subunit n=1 Tax=Amphritea TaxID=515417 RepID=UPI001C065B54|nr:MULTISPECIES: Ni/Fe-hydrogenase, b-type cytochrome subunit [Amphritea]MBU2966399.1 Ni/Fe-hydrogenase, b-type cytochrome subunit [Amphritea atlantica]MDO6419837.1 Ni/Fe-hydrogenase, b-type cytochrome subunit [Amphritea sp. 2_MG-2023]MDX2422050.1 Ni/Fe-hydrogenase, b-type cytochrome subunit [Amphritea sp.]